MEVNKIANIIKKGNNGLVYALQNMNVAICAKLGGTPWLLAEPKKNELIIGIGAFKSDNTQYIGAAFSFDNTGSFNSYQYFLLSDEALFRAGREVKWVADAKADSALYDAALWHGATTPMRKLGERYYCVLYDGQDGTVKLYGGSATELGAVKVLDGARWYGKDGYYHAAWAGLAEYEGKLIFNTSTAFWCYDPTDGTLQKLAELALWPRDKQIFGICDLSPAGEISFVMAADYHGAYEIRTWQISIE